MKRRNDSFRTRPIAWATLGIMTLTEIDSFAAAAKRITQYTVGVSITSDSAVLRNTMGRPARLPNVVIAASHQMLGLQTATATGPFVADITSGTISPLDLEPFCTSRF
jgi:glycine/D-amino acid oxidase-like deaminating enzyme